MPVRSNVLSEGYFTYDVAKHYRTISLNSSMFLKTICILATTKKPYTCGNMTVLIGYDLPGSDIVQNTLNSYDLCCAWYLSYNGCVSFTWSLSTAGWATSICFLKYAVPATSSNSAFVSAHY